MGPGVRCDELSGDHLASSEKQGGEGRVRGQERAESYVPGPGGAPLCEPGVVLGGGGS